MKTIIIKPILGSVMLVAGVVILSQEFGWKMSTGVLLITWGYNLTK